MTYKVRVKIEDGKGINRFMDCEFELKPLTIIMGPPGSGKTTLLRLLFNAIYRVKNNIKETKDLILIGRNYLTGKLRDGVISLGIYEDDTEKPPVIDLRIVSSEAGIEVEPGTPPKKPVFNAVYYIPSDAETLIKYRFVPPIEPYLEFYHLIYRLTVIDRIKRNDQLVNELTFLKNIADNIAISPSRDLIETTEGAEIDISYSSSFAAIIYVLGAMFLNGYFQGNNLILIDNIDSYLHPNKGQNYLALMIWKLVETGATVVLTTHDLLFLNLLTRADCLAKDLGAKVEGIDLDKVEIVILEAWKKCSLIDPRSSWIDTYSEAIKILSC
jgi:AAA15 family ATPase/GTPase